MHFIIRVHIVAATAAAAATAVVAALNNSSIFVTKIILWHEHFVHYIKKNKNMKFRYPFCCTIVSSPYFSATSDVLVHSTFSVSIVAVAALAIHSARDNFI